MFGKNLITESIEDAYHVKRSPFFEGFQRGIQAAMIGAPVGALVSAMKGKSPIIGGLIGGALTGIPAGLISAGGQKLSNLDQEAMIRYHAARIKDREPLFFMPHANQMGKIFAASEE